METIIQNVIGWVKDNCLKDKPGMEVAADTSFFATNILDSLEFLNLVEYLQKEYSIEIDEDDMSPDNFESAESVAKLVASMKP